MKPDLSDPAQRAAYRHELRTVAKGPRIAGVSLAFLGVLLALMRQRLGLGVPDVAIFLVVGLGALLMLTGMALRTTYHARRMRDGE